MTFSVGDVDPFNGWSWERVGHWGGVTGWTAPHYLRLYGAEQVARDRHAPWMRQRGTNENTNGLLRQYFRKGINFDQVTDQRLDDVATELNDRPRACRDDRAPVQLLARWRSQLIAN